MNANPNIRSVLAISDDPEVLDGIRSSLQPSDDLRLVTRPGSLGEIVDDKRFRLSNYDLVICSMASSDAGARAALGTLGDPALATRIVVLTDDDLPLAAARELLRLGAHDVLPATAPSADLRQAVLAHLRPVVPVPARIGTEPERPGRRTQGQVFSVASARGGMGGTSLAVNLATLLLRPKGLMKKIPTNRVALIDLDLQFGNAGLMLDLEDRGALMQIAGGSELPDAAFLRTAMIEHKTGLQVLTAAAQAMPLDAIRPEQVAAVIDALRDEYDYVVIDLPQALVLWLDPVLKRTDRMFMVTETSVSSIRQCRRLIDFYTEDNVALPIEIVVNREARPYFRSSLHKEAEAILDRKFAHWLPRDDEVMRKAADRGDPVVSLSRKCRLASAYARIANDVMKTTPAAVRAGS